MAAESPILSSNFGHNAPYGMIFGKLLTFFGVSRRYQRHQRRIYGVVHTGH
jgi:hypothetical protein